MFLILEVFFIDPGVDNYFLIPCFFLDPASFFGEPFLRLRREREKTCFGVFSCRDKAILKSRIRLRLTHPLRSACRYVSKIGFRFTCISPRDRQHKGRRCNFRSPTFLVRYHDRSWFSSLVDVLIDVLQLRYFSGFHLAPKRLPLRSLSSKFASRSR